MRDRLQAILDSFWRDMLTPVAQARGLSIDELERLVDEKGYLTPKEAEAAGMIDVVGDLYFIPSPASLDQKSQRLLWAFLAVLGGGDGE